MDSFEKCEEVAAYIKLKLTYSNPTVGIICGSGLGCLVNKMISRQTIPYSELPKFPVLTIAGHSGNFIFGEIAGKDCVVMQGRPHLYEGFPLWQLALPIRVMKLLGVKTLIITNAAGSLNPNYNIGDFVVLKDHINLIGLVGNNVLVGKNDSRIGPRFPPTSKAYNKKLREIALRAGSELCRRNCLHEGIYWRTAGPYYESPAEARMMRLMGADIVGMSTTDEVLTAVHAGMDVLAISLVTNTVVMEIDDEVEVNHNDFLEISKNRVDDMLDLIMRIIQEI